MAFPPKSYWYLLCVMVFLPALCHSQDPYVHSRATYYGSPDCLGTPTGACGYGAYGRTINDGSVTGVSKLYRDGAGCGACYQVRCKVPQLCVDDGVNVVVTDYGEGDRTDFVLSTSAYARLAKPNAALELFAFGVVDVEYHRIPCIYPGHNLQVKVHDNSRFPHYLALIFIYQAGQFDITAVEIFQAECQQWRAMRRAYGAVWDMANLPPGEIGIRFQLSSSAGQTWVQPNIVISSEWKAGVVYDTNLQLN